MTFYFYAKRERLLAFYWHQPDLPNIVQIPSPLIVPFNFELMVDEGLNARIV